MNVHETKAALRDHVLDVCQHLLPAGRINGDEFEVGSLAGEPGHSLKVNVNGKVGVWKDFATDDGADNLLELWRRVRGCDITQAMREAAEWLGVPARKPASGRGRSDHDQTLGDTPKGHPKWKGKPAGVWCYTDTRGAPWIIVYRYNKRDGTKAFFQHDYKARKWIEKDGHQLPSPRPIYRLHVIAGRQPGEILLVEGEKCVEALASLGIEATTTLGGAGQIKHADFSPLKGWRVPIWRDADDAGRKYATTAAEILHRAGATPLLVPIPDGKAEGWDIADAVREGWTVEEIHAQLDMAEPVQVPLAGAPVGRFQLLTDSDLENQPERPDLVKGIFQAKSIIVAAGPPGSTKTSFALELGGDVDADLLFHGRPVTPGPAVFIAAEGASKLGLRRRAWRWCRKVTGPTRVYFITEAVRLGDPAEVDELLATLAGLPTAPVLLVVDTLARCMSGADENSARDVGAFIQGCDRIRQQTGAAVLIVHHTTKSGNAERGSGALRGAADTLVMMNREDDLVTVTCEKQKDGPPFEPLHFRLRVIDLGNEQTACVLDPVDSPTQGAKGSAPATLPESRRKVLDALNDAVDGATFSQWLRLAQETVRVSESTFTRAVKDLIAWEHVTKRGERYFPNKGLQS